jgi:antibiotic biosynthesis monooxygenase (ABM) superfamily enzyme
VINQDNNGLEYDPWSEEEEEVVEEDLSVEEDKGYEAWLGLE